MQEIYDDKRVLQELIPTQRETKAMQALSILLIMAGLLIVAVYADAQGSAGLSVAAMPLLGLGAVLAVVGFHKG